MAPNYDNEEEEEEEEEEEGEALLDTESLSHMMAASKIQICLLPSFLIYILLFTSGVKLSHPQKQQFRWLHGKL